ncbi:hypothetical protein B0H13DRAFT_1855550 [Mycena leptocephala]|nr:hypothetical protein B0H13DRAFT_1855550 [Mycena leptocephala]
MSSWEFLRSRPTSTETRNVVNRLATVTLQTGTATATIAVAALVGYLLKKESNIVGVGFAWCLGRTCQTSTYVNWRVYGPPRRRKRLPRRYAVQASPSHSLVRRWIRILASFHFSPLLDAHRTAVVHIENQQDLHPASITIKSSTHGPEHTTDIEIGPLSGRKEEEALNFNTVRAADEQKTNWMTNSGH